MLFFNKLFKASRFVRYIYRIIPFFLKEYANKLKRHFYLRNLRKKGMIKLNLGCGDDIKKDYINIDKYNPKADIRADVCNLKKFKDNFITEILASHILQHIPRRYAKDALKEWNRTLKKQGKLMIQVPNFELYLKQWLSSNSDYQNDLGISHILGYDREGYPHYDGFTPDKLKRMLEDTGFKVFKLDLINQEYNKKNLKYSEFDIYVEAEKY